MASLRQAKTENEIKELTLAKVKIEYNNLAKDYNSILDNKAIYCHKCNDFLAERMFYRDNNYASKKFPICKECIAMMVQQKKRKTDPPNETKESVQRILHMMDLPYDDKFYNSCVKGAEESDTTYYKSPFKTYITCVKSLSQWENKTWANSDFGVDGNPQNDIDIKKYSKVIEASKKRFGNGLSSEDYIFLEDEYQDWITRYECSTKAQEELFERLSFKKWEIRKATLQGMSTKDLDKTYQELFNSADISPKNSKQGGMNDSMTFGQLIEKWEENEPIPEVDPELADVDSIGKKLRVFFSGHLSKALGIQNDVSGEYQEYMDRFTVKKPEYNGVNVNGNNEIYTKLFGKPDDSD